MYTPNLYYLNVLLCQKTLLVHVRRCVLHTLETRNVNSSIILQNAYLSILEGNGSLFLPFNVTMCATTLSADVYT